MYANVCDSAPAGPQKSNGKKRFKRGNAAELAAAQRGVGSFLSGLRKNGDKGTTMPGAPAEDKSLKPMCQTTDALTGKKEQKKEE